MPVKNEQINVWVAENIRELMDAKGYKQPALAQKAGVAQKTVSNFLRPAQRSDGSSGRAPSGTLTNLAKIADALEVPAWQLTRPTNKAEREFYSRLEVAYRMLVEGPPVEELAAKPAEQPPSSPAQVPTDKHRRMAERARLGDLPEDQQSNHGGKSS